MKTLRHTKQQKNKTIKKIIKLKAVNLHSATTNMWHQYVDMIYKC